MMLIDDCLAVIMAGGDSRRMGRDKASLALGERTLLQHVAATLQPIFPQLVVSVRTPRADLGLTQICDQHADAGPLAGLYAALLEAERRALPWVFAVATDMPFVQPALIAALAAGRGGANIDSDIDAVLPVIGGHPQPLAAFYGRRALPCARALLEAATPGRRSLRALLEQLNVASVHEAPLLAADPGLRSFLDLDTPQDLRAAQELAARMLLPTTPEDLH